MRYLVLSLFPGADLFGEAFEREGFCVVRGPELILGQDIRTWSAIEGKFDVVIGGPPCKSFSSVGRWKKPSQGNLIPEFERVVSEAKPTVFVMENVREAPIPDVKGYAIQNQILNAHHYGAKQNRKRRFTLGYKHDGSLSLWPFFIEDPLPMHKRAPDPFPTVIASEGKFPTNCAGRKMGRRLTIQEVCELQGVPEKTEAWFLTPRGISKRVPFRKEFTYELIGNGVEMNTGRVVARAVKNGLKHLNGD
jgi:DNA (cytosine-5)-methyltransferase 1